MRISRLTVACLVAMFAISAAVTASASAVFKEEPPEVGRCLKLAGGKFKDGNCKTAAKVSTEQKYEWYPGFGPNGKGEEKLIEPSKRAYKAVSKEATAIRLETVNGEGVTCKTQSSDGELTGPKTNRNFNIAFTGCESAGFLCISTNPKAGKAGEIQVKELLGIIGVYKTGETVAKDKLANLFTPASGEILTEFECSGLKLVVKGEVMVPIKTNAMASTQTVKFTATKGKQKPEKFVADPVGTKRVLYAKNSKLEEFFQAGQTLTTIQTSTSGEKVEASTIN
jgi:hypothetical protein